MQRVCPDAMIGIVSLGKILSFSAINFHLKKLKSRGYFFWFSFYFSIL